VAGDLGEQRAADGLVEFPGVHADEAVVHEGERVAAALDALVECGELGARRGAVELVDDVDDRAVALLVAVRARA
jgi:hypothetical protein